MAKSVALLAALAFAALAGADAAAAAPGGKPVQTETVIVPKADGDRAMPAIPAEGDDGDATGSVNPGSDLEADAPAELPVIEYDPEKLPPPVKRLREQILDAARSGDPEKLRPIIDAHEEPPEFSFDDAGDPIAFLKSLSGDAEGREILAILLEVLEAGYVHVEVGAPEEMYIWPYFARYPVDKLTAPQIVELFKLVYAGDYEDMRTYGAYISYRVGIAPDGTWKFFLVGD